MYHHHHHRFWQPSIHNEWRNSASYGPYLPLIPISGPLVDHEVERQIRRPPPEVQRYLDIDIIGRKNGSREKAETNSHLHVHITEVKESASVSGLQPYCDACQKTFGDNARLEAHLKTHTKCFHPNCSFIASSQALKLHEIQCHRQGKMQIILNTPEEIAKWREERKRNYPTVSNIAKKLEKQKKQRESGQSVKAKEFRYNNRQGWRQPQGRRGGCRRGTRTHHHSYAQSREPHDMEFDASSSSCITRNGNVGLTGCIADVDSNTVDMVDNVKECSSALGALASQYGVSSSDEDGDNEVDRNKEQSQKVVSEDLANSQKIECDPVKERKEVEQLPNDKDGGKKLVKKKQSKKWCKKRENQSNIPKGKRPRLLEMLLVRDIQRERNVLLQCLRYIVKNDFFGCGDSENSS